MRRRLGSTKGMPDRHAGRDVPSRMHTKGPTARRPYTCGSIPQHNTLQHPGSMEPMLCKMGLPSKAPSLNKVFADGHTASNAPDLFRPPKLSGAGPGQYWGGGPPGKPLGCCQLFACVHTSMHACICARWPCTDEPRVSTKRNRYRHNTAPQHLVHKPG